VSKEIREAIKDDIIADHEPLEPYEADRLAHTAAYNANIPVNSKYIGVELIDCEYVAQFSEPEITANDGVINSDVEIREGTKTGYSEVLFSSKPNEETRDILKAAGFRWSRFNGVWYGKTENLPTLTNGNKSTTQTSSKPASGERFRTMADKMQATIDDKIRDRKTKTPKKLAQANHARFEGARLERTQKALYKLADLADNNNIPDNLKSIKSKKHVYDLMAETREPVNNGYHKYIVGTGEPYKETPETLALWSLLDDETQEQKQEKELQRKIEG